MNLLHASSRVAFAAMIHDLGKLVQRANLPFSKEQKETHIQLYCPHHVEGNWWSHHHAAYTSLAFDVIEKSAPDLIRGEMEPFASRNGEERDITDSLVNAAAMHHNPHTLLQWIIATADRVASGFEREEFEKYNNNNGKQEEVSETGKNFLQARMLTLFEQIRLTDDDKAPITAGTMQWCYPLKPLSAESLFPCMRKDYEPRDNDSAQKQYAELWEAFKEGLERIPHSHRQSWPLWLDHFDTAWLTYTHAVPSATAFGVKPDVSLYDHSKATAALAVALWRYHHRHPQKESEAIRKISDRTASGGLGNTKIPADTGRLLWHPGFHLCRGKRDQPTGRKTAARTLLLCILADGNRCAENTGNPGIAIDQPDHQCRRQISHCRRQFRRNTYATGNHPP